MDWKESFPKNNRYFEDENTLLYFGNAKNILEELPPNCCDIIITDPPFGINKFDYENENDIFFSLEDLYFRVLKRDSWFIFFWTIKRIPEISKFIKFQYRWMIVMRFHSTYSKCILGDRTYAPVFVFAKGNPKVCFKRCDTIFGDELPIVETKISAPDFKPTYALSQLLTMFTKSETIVLDPFIGFGSLALVCKIFNRRFVGIEKDENRLKVTVKLLKEGKLVKPIPEILNEITEKKNIKNEIKTKTNLSIFLIK